MSIVKYIIKEEHKRLKRLIKFYEKELLNQPSNKNSVEKLLKKAKKNFDECERFLKVD